MYFTRTHFCIIAHNLMHTIFYVCNPMYIILNYKEVADAAATPTTDLPPPRDTSLLTVHP
jgi:hypothetical protein